MSLLMRIVVSSCLFFSHLAQASVSLPAGVLPEDVDAAMRLRSPWRLSAFPLGQRANGCGPQGFDGVVADGWGLADFTQACNHHDACYWTLGSRWQECNSHFHAELRSACLGAYGGRDGDVLGKCLQVADTYHAGVQAGVWFGVYRGSQGRQARYEDEIREALPAIEEEARIREGKVFGEPGS